LIKPCVICLTPSDSLTEEHIFPVAIGGSLAVPALCSRCNSETGHAVDVLLTDDPLVMMIRSGLGIQSRDGLVPNPLHRGQIVGEEPLRASVIVDEHGQQRVVAEYSEQAITSPEGREQILIHGDAKRVDAAMKKKVERAQRDGKQLRIETLERTVQKAVVRKSWTRDASHLLRPMLKIAYEMTVGWLGPAYLSDPQAASIRSCIVLGSINDIDAEVGYFPPRSAFLGVGLPATDHAAALHLAENDRAYCAVRIFNVIEGVVLVTERRAAYPHARDSFLALDPISREVRSVVTPEPHPSGLSLRWVLESKAPERFLVETLRDGVVTYEVRLELCR
jgi:hypothetical protein